MWSLSPKPNPSENIVVVIVIIIIEEIVVVIIIRKSRISNSRNDRWIKETGEGTIHHENVHIGVGNEELSRRLKPLDRSDEETKNLSKKKMKKKEKFSNFGNSGNTQRRKIKKNKNEK